MEDHKREKAIEESVRRLFDAIEVDRSTEMYKNTPRRVARMYTEILSGMHNDEELQKMTLFDNPGDSDIVCLRNIPFYSLCAHHFLPMFGTVSIAYIPNKKIIGFSKMPRVVKHFSTMPQVQEKFTNDVADYIYKRTGARGVFVMVRARHLCMEMRGVKSRSSEAVSRSARGLFKTSSSMKNEALKLILGAHEGSRRTQQAY